MSKQKLSIHTTQKGGELPNRLQYVPDATET
jgi:hypothetical protein